MTPATVNVVPGVVDTTCELVVVEPAAKPPVQFQEVGLPEHVAVRVTLPPTDATVAGEAASVQEGTAVVVQLTFLAADGLPVPLPLVAVTE